MFKDQIECNEAIARALMRSIDEAWTEVRLIAKLDVDSMELMLVYKPQGKDRFSGSVAPPGELGRFLFELSEMVSTPEKGVLKRCIFTVHRDGRYKADFTY